MEKKRKLLRGLLFLLCIGIMDYPFITRMLHSRQQKAAVDVYEETVKELGEKECLKMFEDADIYNGALYEKNVFRLQDAFAKPDKVPDTYDTLLNVDGRGMIGMLEIPKIKLKLPIFHGTSAGVLQKGAGHLKGSSLPTGGENTHTCIAAHRGLPSQELFTKLDLVETGDSFYIYVLGEMLTYQVQDIKTVMPDETGFLQIQKGKDLATLITCTPYGINTHRLYVQGVRTEGQWQKFKIMDFVKIYWWAVITTGLVLLYIRSSLKEDRRQFCKKRRDP